MKPIDEKYMSRALYLASLGAGHVSPNPLVGAVIVSPEDKIIGEGFHRKYGEAHAEVNAVRSVKEKDRHLLKDSTMYVTLEPCSHYGKTPPCAAMLSGILEEYHCTGRMVKRVVIGSGDPNPKVAGKGIAMLREAGIEVIENCLQKECRELNVRFFTAQTLKRPWILLKWAETSDGKMAEEDGSPISISNSVTMALMHAERAQCDGIMVGTNTLITDNPSLTNREWPGNSPRPVIFQSEKWKDKVKDFKVFERNPIILNPEFSLEKNMKILFSDYGITSLMVEGGRKLLDSFFEAKLFDRIRCEIGTKSS